MNDFLQSIRGNQKEKRIPKTRRNFDNGNFNSTQNFPNQGNYQSTRAGNIKRTRTPPNPYIAGDEPQLSYSNQVETLDVMQELLETYTKNQSMLISVHEKRIIAEERKAIALEEIAEYLRVLTMPSFHDKFSLKEREESCKEPISSDVDDQINVYNDKDDTDVIYPSEAIQADEILESADNEINSDDVVTVQVVESQPIDGEVIDDDHDNYIDGNAVDAQYVDAQTNKKNSYFENAGSTKDSSSSILDKDIDKEEQIKVIRRKKSYKKDAQPFTPDDSDELSKDNKSKSKVILPPEEEKLSAQNIEAAPTDNELSLLSREEIIEIINSMRAKGKTFDEVAQHLINLGQPTFSGRGVWHAQTIHRICTRNERKASNLKKKGISTPNSRTNKI